MQVIILADRMGQEMAPMDQRYPPALLPLVGRSVLERNLDLLADTPDIQAACLLYGRSSESFRAMFNRSDRWGMPIELYPVIGERDPREHLLRLGGNVMYPCLVVRGDILLHPDWIKAPGKDAPVVVARGPEDLNLIRLRWSELREERTLSPCLLASLSDYHQLTMDILQRQTPVAPHGTEILDRLWGSAGTATPDTSVLEQGFMGAVAHVERGAWLTGHCSLETGCYLEEGAELENMVVMPYSHVGGVQRLKNGIYYEGQLLDPKLGYWFKDRRQAGTLVLRGVAFKPQHRPGKSERLLSALLWVMVLPLAGKTRALRGELAKVVGQQQRLFGPNIEHTPAILGYAARVTRGVFIGPKRCLRPDIVADCIDAIRLTEYPKLRQVLLRMVSLKRGH
ncbi:hypothetical protein [Larsenimonas salina]|uniref:hypothetical protein n=1 Tax=Larsenimonas salina TaxID=1295565 RepID=UPI00207436E7|nr:hypothetical protein [Larsenimonas salina]MCM5703271.1 hypothetical protein [Larsenimonas salina]